MPAYTEISAKSPLAQFLLEYVSNRYIDITTEPHTSSAVIRRSVISLYNVAGRLDEILPELG